MIHKIESLVSIGKFRNYQAQGDVAFKKLTLIYADNGSGKTTMSSIFRSLGESDPTRITKRKSTNSVLAQSARIIQRPLGSADVTHSFSAAGWRHQYSDIEIFDVHFVDENIYSGCEFSEEHKKQLHQFVIGAQSVAIQQQIDQNKLDKSTSRTTQSSLEGQLIIQVANGMQNSMIATFLSMARTQANNIDQRILDAEASLRSANANAVIQTLQNLSEQSGIQTGIDFEALSNDLAATTQTIQDQVLQELFNQHSEELLAHGISEPEAWLKTGFHYVEHKKTQGVESNCPFCSQRLPGALQIIAAYTNLFNEEFNALAERLNGYLASLLEINIEAQIQRIDNLNTGNAGKVASWSAYLPATTVVPNSDILANVELLKNNLTQLTTTVRSKAQNPSVAADIDHLNSFKDLITAIDQNVEQHNQTVANYNQAITTFRNSIHSVEQAQTNLNTLNRIKMRFEPAIAAICTQLQRERQNLRTLESDYGTLAQQQQSAAQTFFATYRDRINHYLGTVFKTAFAIDNVIHVAPVGRATQNKINYMLTMEGHEISFDANSPNNAKDCLSEGDKSTIALAFFLSKLDIDPSKANKILIFDDPLSSFDSNRRMYTVQLIKNLLPQLKQIIVLSHNEYFLHEIYKRVAAAERKTLRINQNHLTQTAFIESFDLDKLVENAYFKHVKELESFLAAPDLNKKDTVLGWLRNVLEAHIRFKFYRQLRVIPPNDQTFGRVITTLVNDPVVFRDPNKQQVIDLLSLINAISCKPHHGEPEPDFAFLGTDPATINQTELCNFVLDTLNLIDNRL